MKISMTCENLSLNSIMRVYPFAVLMREKFDVEIVGLTEKNKGVFAPIRNEPIKYFPLRYRKFFPYYLLNMRDMYKALDGNFIHAFKVTSSSFGVPMLKKWRTGKKVIIDIDDIESSYVLDNYFKLNPVKLGQFFFVDFYMPESYWIRLFLEKIVKKADAVITSSRTLQRMFGGTWIPSGPDTNCFDPERYSRSKIRKEFGIERDEKLVLFCGTPREHKGVKLLVDAVKQLNREDIRLMFVGAAEHLPMTKWLKEQREQDGNLKGMIIEGYREHNEMPYFYAAADIVCAPQLASKSANAQLPIKIFEPMAMEKAVIATDVSDMKEIFDGCGKVVEPNNINTLVQAIQEYADSRQLRLKHGKQARQKCVKEYDWKIMKKKTLEVYENCGAI